jgi:CheY-like chemotaxis protein
MSSDEKSKPATCSSAVTSELNNLLQIISGAALLLEDNWSGSDDSKKYFKMLHESVARAEGITAQLAGQSGGTKQNLLLHPGLAATARPKPSPPSSTPSKPSILVIDDEPMAAMLMKRTLSDAGFQVVTARSGFEALDLVRKRSREISLVICDLTMPFMDGEETFERIRDINENIPFVLVTGFMEQERLNRMLSAGLAGFLRKPHGPEQLLNCVQSIFASSNLSFSHPMPPRARQPAPASN